MHLLAIGMIVIGAVGWLRFRWWPWFHLPFAFWGVFIQWIGWTCPLTPLENRFRQLAGEQGYRGGFVEYYIMPLIYPGPMTAAVQYVLGGLVLIVNVVIYVWIWRRRRSAVTGSEQMTSR